MTDISAAEAARRFADLLDAVERGEHFTIVRRGRAVARLEPLRRGRGADVKALMRAHRPVPAWADDVRATRQLLDIEEHC